MELQHSSMASPSILESVPPTADLAPSHEPQNAIDRELKRMLSLNSVISTTSSTTTRNTAAQKNEEEAFTKIGAGACGAIFAQEGKSVVVKLSKTTQHDDLWNDYQKHKEVEVAFRNYHIDNIQVPECYYFLPADTPQWFDERPGLEEAAKQVCHHFPPSVLMSERILPLPKPTRTLLIEKYCSPRNKAQALAAPANNDCLVRLYLGSSHGKSGGQFFSLRNFKLHLNQMVELELDVEEIARRMGVTIAIMHWETKADARDIEFVLGSSSKKSSHSIDNVSNLAPHTYTGPPSFRDEDFFYRVTKLWVLDFNQVRSITMDEVGVAQAVEAAVVNDPYLPKPLQESAVEKKVWNAFVVSYIDTSTAILGEELVSLPRMFLLGLIETQRCKQQAAAARQWIDT